MSYNETVSQAYSWLHFWVRSVRHWTLPLWDPYIFAGRSYAGEMQTAAFYPLHAFFALFPLGRSDLLAPQIYHVYFVLVHVQAAWFMFALIRELGLSRFSAVVAGVCFSVGGFMGQAPWLHLVESALWLPLLFLLLLRALTAESPRRALVDAGLAGLTLGMSILAGGLHVAMMEAIVVVTAAGYHAVQTRELAPAGPWKESRWTWPAALALIVVCIGLAAGAIQLLPSIEYGARAVRWVSGGVLPASLLAYYVNRRKDRNDKRRSRGLTLCAASESDAQQEIDLVSFHRQPQAVLNQQRKLPAVGGVV